MQRNGLVLSIFTLLFVVENISGQENLGYIYKAFPDSFEEYLSYIEKSEKILTGLTESENHSDLIMTDSAKTESGSSKKSSGLHIGQITVNPSFDFSKKIEINPNIKVDDSSNLQNFDFSKKTETSPDIKVDDSSNLQKKELPNLISNVIRITNEFSLSKREYFIDNCIESIDCRRNISFWLLVFFCGIPLFLIVLRQIYCKIKSNKHTQKLLKMKKNDKKENLKSLAPVCDELSFSKGIELLEYAIFDNDEVKNIAITGPYGSGKSSLWKSFEKKDYSTLSVLHPVKISLAKFNESVNKCNDKPCKEENEIQKLEESIIQQLLYSQTEKTLKYSRFFRIRNMSKMKALLISFCLIIVIAAFELILFPGLFGKVCIAVVDELNSVSALVMIAGVIVVYTLYRLVQMLNKCRISGVCVKDVKIEIGDNQHLLNKYLDEIIYFFVATECKCLLVEDLDRFNSLSIFAKLREINLLINQYPEIRKTGTVKFIYAIRDDFLNGESKTKFFDFIVPVIPVVSKDNAADFVERIIREKNDLPLEKRYLKNVQDYLTDVRIVKNCINEFHVYNNELKDFYLHIFKEKNPYQFIEKIDEKIFSLLLYKSLCPIDFRNLCNHHGIMYECLYSLEKVVKKYDENGLTLEKADAKTLLNGSNGDKCRICITRYVESEKENCKNELTDADPNLIGILLAEGYVDDSYNILVSKFYDNSFHEDERVYLFNVKNDIPSSKNLFLCHYEDLEQEIKDFQWNSMGVLNFGMIDYLLRSNPKDLFSKVRLSKVVGAMQSYYDKKGENLLDEYLSNENITTEKKEMLYEALCILVKAKNLGERNEFFSFVFNKGNVGLFKDFVHSWSVCHYQDDINLDIGRYLDWDEQFKQKLFIMNEDDLNSLSMSLDDAEVKISLTNDLAKILIEQKCLNVKFYKLDKKNVDKIFALMNENNELEMGYLTKCLSIEGLHEKVLNEIGTFCDEILSKFEKINESFSGTKEIFSANISDEVKKKFFIKMPDSWENFILYNRYVSLDNVLESRITSYLHDSKWDETTIMNLVKEDELSAKYFVASIIAKSKIDDNLIENIFIPIWNQNVSILSCFDGNVDLIKLMESSRIHLMIRYAIAQELDNLGNVPFLYMVMKEPSYFEGIYPEEEFAKDSPFKKFVFGKKDASLLELKKHFLRETDMYPLNDIMGKTLYKQAAEECNPNLSTKNYSELKKQLDAIKSCVTPIGNINLYSFERHIPSGMLNMSDMLDYDQSVFEDYWTKMLWNVLKYRLHQIARFIAMNTFNYPNNMQGLKEIDRDNPQKVHEMNKQFRGLYRQLMESLEEIKTYVA